MHFFCAVPSARLFYRFLRRQCSDQRDKLFTCGRRLTIHSRIRKTQLSSSGTNANRTTVVKDIGCMLDSSVLDGVGWKVRGAFISPEATERTAFFPRIRYVVDLVPMVIRCTIYTLWEWLKNKEVFINVFSQLKHDPFTGVPIGGIGSGSIGTDFRGAFNKFALTPGVKEQKIGNIKANQFILTVHNASNSELVFQSLLTTADFTNSTLCRWTSCIKKADTRYRGLFPRAWREIQIPEIGITLICEQMSPVIPHNYEVTSFPLCNFYWTVINNSGNNYKVSLTFTFRNGTGNAKWERESLCSAEILQIPSAKGLKLFHTIKLMQTTYAVVAEQTPGSTITCATFNPCSTTGHELWDDLKTTGSLAEELDKSEELGIAVSSRFDLPSFSSKTSTFCLVWFMPLVQFGNRSRLYKRFYTRYIGEEDAAVEKLIKRSITEGISWRAEIEKWQKPVINDESLPEWYRSALFNELYYVVDGGSMWFEYDPSWKDLEPIDSCTEKQLRKYGRFGYMESWEYLMVNTYDVHYYSCWAFVKNWPQLELSIQLDICDQLYRTDPRTATSLKDGTRMEIKTYSRIPHDVGNPHAEPWAITNAYLLHDSAIWRDLNLKFILSCWRDYKLIVEKSDDQEGRVTILRYFCKQSEAIVRNALSEWDQDGDGMIENSGLADQTYDVWTMTGTSAYCGSLWLAALSTLICMTTEVGDTDSVQYFQNVLDRAKQAFVKKLWNGKYFKFDEAAPDNGIIMADQLCGIWALTMLQQDEILSAEQISSTLHSIYSHNVKLFAGGKLGPVNGIFEDGSVDISSLQSEEVWTGTAYSLASFMIAKGKWEEGMGTAEGMFDSVWNRMGLQYQTPEAIYEKKYYRAIGYMRPLAVWAIQHALEMRSIEK